MLWYVGFCLPIVKCFDENNLDGALEKATNLQFWSVKILIFGDDITIAAIRHVSETSYFLLLILNPKRIDRVVRATMPNTRVTITSRCPTGSSSVILIVFKAWKLRK